MGALLQLPSLWALSALGVGAGRECTLADIPALQNRVMH